MTTTHWLDTFGDGSLDTAKFTTALAGTGSVTETGGQLVVNNPSTGNPAVVYLTSTYKVLESGVYQEYEIKCTPTSVASTGAVWMLGVRDGTSALTGLAATVNANLDIACRFDDNDACFFEYVNTSAQTLYWNQVTGAWSTTYTAGQSNFGGTTQGVTFIVRLLTRADGYWCLVLLNGAGTKEIAHSDWVAWTSVRSEGGDRLAWFGSPYTDSWDGVLTLEYFEFTETDEEPAEAWYNGTNDTGTLYKIGKSYSIDPDLNKWNRASYTYVFGPPSGYTLAKDPYPIDVAGTRYLFYAALHTATTKWRIGYATATAAFLETWSDQGIILSESGAGERANGHSFPAAYHDGSAWHLYSVAHDGSDVYRIYYATHASLGSLGSIAKIIDVGAGGSFSDGSVAVAKFRTDGTNHKIYGSGYDGAKWQGALWESTSLGSGWAEAASQPEIARVSGDSTTLSGAEAAGQTDWSVTSTTIGAADRLIAIGDTSGTDRELNRIKTVGATFAMWSPAQFSYASGATVHRPHQGSIYFAETGYQEAILTMFQGPVPLLEYMVRATEVAGTWVISEVIPLALGSNWDTTSTENMRSVDDLWPTPAPSTTVPMLSLLGVGA